MDIAPILAVLAVFEHGDIQIRKLACDVGEMGIVPAVAAEENPLRRSFDDERSPQRPVRPKRTSGKVPRGTAIYRKTAAERNLFAPVKLRDPLRIETPIFEILAHTQRADDAARAVAQLRYRAVVEMVPMVVCDDQQVDPRHILGFIEIGPLERSVEKRQGRSRFENGIDQNTQPVCLNQVGGVAEPDQQVLFRIERFQVGLHCRQRMIGTVALLTLEKEVVHRSPPALSRCELRRRMPVAESAVAVIGRTPDPFQPLPARSTPEFGPIHKKGDRRDQQGRNCKENDHTANYFTFHIEQQTCIAEVS